MHLSFLILIFILKIALSIDIKKDISRFSFFVDLENYKNEQFYGVFNIRDAPFNTFIYDTGSNFIWTTGISTKLVQCSNIFQCTDKFLDTEISLITWIKYGTGNVGIKSKHGMFTLAVNSDGRGVSKFTESIKYGESVFEDEKTFKNVPFRGIIGLGFSPDESWNEYDSLLSILSSNRILKHNIFAFYLQGEKNQLNFGELNIAIPPTTEFHFTSLSSSHSLFWTIEIESFIVHGIDICFQMRLITGRCNVILDSGTSYYAAPLPILQAITRTVSSDPMCRNYDTLPSMKIRFHESDYGLNNDGYFDLVLNPQDYITKEKLQLNLTQSNENTLFSVNRCQLDFGKSKLNAFILGIKFLKKFYTIFDFERKIVGFGKIERTNNTNDNSIKYSELIKNKKEINTLINQWKKVYG